MGKFLWTAIERSTNGPIMSEEKFETELFPTVLGDLQAKYKIERDPDDPIMTDPDMADAIFQAGMELLLEVGLYCKDTRRIIKFTREEILEAVSTARHEITLGHGRQAIDDQVLVECFNLTIDHGQRKSNLGSGVPFTEVVESD